MALKQRPQGLVCGDFHLFGVIKGLLHLGHVIEKKYLANPFVFLILIL